MIKQVFISFLKYLGRLLATPVSLFGYLYIIYFCSSNALLGKTDSTILDIVFYFLLMIALFLILFYSTRYFKRLVKEEDFEDAPDEENN